MRVPTDIEEAVTFLRDVRLGGVEITRVTIPATTSRSACLIQTNEQDWFVKQVDDALRREDFVYQLAEEGVLPPVVSRELPPRAAGRNAGVRVYHAYRNCQPWQALLDAPQGYGTRLADRIGQWIGAMHRDASGTPELLNRTPTLSRNTVRTYAAISVEAYVNAPGFQYRAFLSAAQRVSHLLADLAERGTALTVVLHGDLKVDNLLVGDASLHLVDWELCCLGDPMFDLGTLIGSVVSSWLELVPIREARPMSDWFAGARVSSGRLGRSLAALVEGYERGLGRALTKSQRMSLWGFAGYFLLERGHVSNWIYGRFLLGTLLAMELGTRLIEHPELGDAIFLAASENA